MEILPPTTDPLIATPEALQALLSRLPTGPGVRAAVDTEADSLHSYKEKLCLIQLACDDARVIIDPLGIPDLMPFVRWMEQVEVWMHGADFDMTLMRRTFDVIPERIFDTQVAARLCGERQFGLAAIVESVVGVVLSKQSQRADWGRRPLSQKMVDYALNDVHFIIEIADHYLERLRALGREEWFLESCADARNNVLARPAPDPDETWRINGCGKLRPAGLNYLRALWHWRDGEAERLDRPAFKIIGNQDLLTFSETLESGGEVRLPDRFPPSSVRRFIKGLSDARDLPEAEWPRRPVRRRQERNPDAERRFDQLKAKRDKLGQSLELDPSLLGSRAVFELIAHDATRAGELLLKWQRDVMGL